jgi:hypothetical protein
LVLQKCGTPKRKCDEAKQEGIASKELIDRIERFEKYFQGLTSFLIFIIRVAGP